MAARALAPTCPAPSAVAPAIDFCRATASGVIGFRIARMQIFTPTKRGYSCDYRTEINLVHIDAAEVESRTHVGESLPLDDGGIDPANYSILNGWKWGMLGAPTFFDFDGDGEPEVLVNGISIDAGPDEWGGLAWHEAWSFYAGKWLKYAPLANKKFSRAEDFDKDGRPDLRTAGPYESILAISGLQPSSEKIFEPIFLLHSLPSGDFSIDDSVAKKAVEEKCAKASSLPFKTSPQNLNSDDASGIACARLHGASEADVMKKITSTCKGYFEDVYDQAADHCPIWTKQIAAVTPPFTLP